MMNSAFFVVILDEWGRHRESDFCGYVGLVGGSVIGRAGDTADQCAYIFFF